MILLSLSLYCHFHYNPHISCCSVDIRLRECAYNCDVPNQRWYFYSHCFNVIYIAQHHTATNVLGYVTKLPEHWYNWHWCY